MRTSLACPCYVQRAPGQTGEKDGGFCTRQFEKDAVRSCDNPTETEWQCSCQWTMNDLAVKDEVPFEISKVMSTLPVKGMVSYQVLTRSLPRVWQIWATKAVLGRGSIHRNKLCLLFRPSGARHFTRLFSYLAYTTDESSMS